MKIRAFITHKQSEHYSDCQDRYAINEDTHTLAVSDGMSESVFPDIWANLLSQHYANHGHCTEEELENLRKEWLQNVEEYLKEEREAGRNPWRLENCINEKKGAGATICGVRFTDASKWECDVLGDSCAIEVDITGHLPLKIYTSEDKAFDSYPDYYDSFPGKRGRGTSKKFSGVIDEKHFLLVVSDPYAEYFYKHKEECGDWIKKALELSNHQDYCRMVEEWRKHGLHNDDSTLCIIEYDGKIAFDVEYCDDIEFLIGKEGEQGKENPPSVEQAIIQGHPTTTNIDDSRVTIENIVEKLKSLRKICTNRHCKLIKKQRQMSHRRLINLIDEIIESLTTLLTKDSQR